MKNAQLFPTTALLFTALLACSSLPAQEIQVAVGYLPPQEASADAKFASAPPISSNDAGNLAIAKLVDGRIDFNGAPASVLFDGRGAGNQDDPQSNFFLAGNQSGRLLIDIGQAIELKQFNTYSWHPFLRGPQVYSLYGLDPSVLPGTANATEHANLTEPIAISTDPAASGWVKIADVDTRPTHGTSGGQYAVSVRRSNGEALGNYRYLLMAISATAVQRPDSQTFYSEIDLIDGNFYPTRMESGAIDMLEIGGKYKITFDTTEMPELRDWVRKVLKPTCEQWYPKIVELFPSDNFTAPQAFTIYFHRDMEGVANASGTRINCAGKWYVQNLAGEAPGSVVHEMVHIVQQYSGRRGSNRNPGWMVEGVADYVRWFLYEPEQKRPKPDPRRSNYDDSYRTTAAFINYAVNHYNAELATKMNAAMREGRYSDRLWVQYTGKSAEELWKEYIERELR